MHAFSISLKCASQQNRRFRWLRNILNVIHFARWRSLIMMEGTCMTNRNRCVVKTQTRIFHWGGGVKGTARSCLRSGSAGIQLNWIEWRTSSLWLLLLFSISPARQRWQIIQKKWNFEFWSLSDVEFNLLDLSHCLRFFRRIMRNAIVPIIIFTIEISIAILINPCTRVSWPFGYPFFFSGNVEF